MFKISQMAGTRARKRLGY